MHRILLLISSLGILTGGAFAQPPADSPVAPSTAEKLLQEIKALNDRMRTQLGSQMEQPDVAKSNPQIHASKVQVPARTARLIRSLEANLGTVPAMVVIDGSYVEVFVPNPTPAFIRAIAAAETASKADYDLQVEQIGTTKLSPEAESYRKQIQDAGAPETGLALVSRWAERRSIRFAYAPRRITLGADQPSKAATPPIAPPIAHVATPQQTPQKLALSVGSKSKPAPSKSTASIPEPAIGEITVAQPVMEPSSPPVPPATPAAISRARTSINPVIPEAGDLPQATAPASVTAKSPPEGGSIANVQHSQLPEPDVIVIELPRDRGKVQSKDASDVVGVISVNPQ